jgi:hypothetical protein
VPWLICYFIFMLRWMRHSFAEELPHVPYFDYVCNECIFIVVIGQAVIMKNTGFSSSESKWIYRPNYPAKFWCHNIPCVPPKWQNDYMKIVM